MSSWASNKTYLIFVIVLSTCALLFCYKLYVNAEGFYMSKSDVLQIREYLFNNDLSNVNISIRCHNDSTFDFLPSFSKFGIPGYYRKLNNCTRNQELKKIFTYHKFWNFVNFDQVFKNCPVNSCVLYTDLNLLPVQNYDAVIFNTFLNNTNNPRSPHQKYIFFNLESPYNTDFQYSTVPNFFNWTMSYRRDSDIHYPYGMVIKQKTDYKLPSLLKIRKKSKMVAWFVSNCQTAGTKRRQKYVEELQKYIQVDIYGECGTLKCEKLAKGCYEMLEKDYLFYLSFENSMCFDYVTEKLFHILQYDVVPIVMGYSNYESIAPSDSLINVDHFPSPKRLADYLFKIINNPNLYLNYFNWKKNYIIGNKQTRIDYIFCQLCDLLHRPLSYSSYDDIKQWFYGYNCYQY